eukprot:301820-Pleurochrysis_carterae.AAC.1
MSILMYHLRGAKSYPSRSDWPQTGKSRFLSCDPCTRLYGHSGNSASKVSVRALTWSKKAVAADTDRRRVFKQLRASGRRGFGW